MERMDDTYETSYLYQGSTAELIFRKAEIKDAGLLTEIYDSSFYSDYILRAIANRNNDLQPPSKTAGGALRR